MAFVLLPTPPIADWLEEFDTFARRSPGFFAGRPVVVDISAMPPTRPDLVHMVTELKRRHITIMGLDGRTPGELGADARGLPPILTGGREIASIAQASAEMLEAAAAPKPEPQPEEAPAEAAETAASTDTDEASAEGEDKAADAPAKDTVAEAALAAVEKAVDEPSPPSQALLIDQPVRSGQSIVHLTGDVTVIGSVASGSEIVASGSIHVYGALRGRAIAGSNGNRSARIFCSALHAELVAIDGLYKTAEDLDRKCIGKAVQAWLDGDALKMAAFNGKG